MSTALKSDTQAPISFPTWEKPYETLTTEYDPETKALFCHMQATPRPCFTPRLLADISTFQEATRKTVSRELDHTGESPVKHLILSSSIPRVFNLGGDLNTFVRCIRSNDRTTLTEYAHTCIKVLYQNLRNLDLPLSTIALLEGNTLGGGFEAALSCDAIVAEKGITMGFPEVIFNLFPGMGGYSFLARRLSPIEAERIIMSGKTYTSEEMFEMGVVDVLAEEGEGKDALYDFMGKSERKSVARDAMRRIRDRVNPITFEELRDITDLWVESAFKLPEKDLRMMERLVRAQTRSVTGGATPEESKVIQFRRS